MDFRIVHKLFIFWPIDNSPGGCYVTFSTQRNRVLIQTRFEVRPLALSERRRKILRVVVENYIETAEPIGSKAIAEKAGLTKVQAKAALDATVESVTKSLAKGDKVALIGFGTFAVVEKGERTGINPRTK